MAAKFNIGERVFWECIDSRDAMQEVTIVGYIPWYDAWEIETDNGVRWYEKASAGTLFTLKQHKAFIAERG